MASPMLNGISHSPVGTAPVLKTQLSKRSLELLPNGQPRFHGCSSIKRYNIVSKLGEGTFGEVYKAVSLKTNRTVALKKILMHHEKEGFPITALREIKLLKLLSHPNILKLEEVVVERKKEEGNRRAILYMVTPYMDHDLSGLLENPAVRFSEPQIKCYMLQLLQGLQFLHASKILHRDMKAANLLINNEGVLQIADFGLARPYDDPAPEPGKGGGQATRDYTTMVVTRWYRPPELLLHLRRYTTAVDMWGVGCVFGEMFKGRPILMGNSDLDQAQKIFALVGSPTEDNMPGWSLLPGCDGVTTFEQKSNALHQAFREQGSSAISLLNELLKLDWRKRINAMDAIKHPYFTHVPLPAKPGDLPRFEDSHELDRRKFRGQKAAPPPAPAGGTVGMGPNGDFTHGVGPSNHHPSGYRGGSGNYPNGQGQYGPRRDHYDGRQQVPPIYDHRNPTSHSLPPQRPTWARDVNGIPPGPGLPPRPPGPPPSAVTWGGQGRAPLVREDSRGGQPNGARDTYIPSYAGNRENRDRVYRGRDGEQRNDDRGDRGRYDDRREHGPREPARRRSRSPDLPRDRDRNRETYRR